MDKKKILVIGPVSAQASDVQQLAHSLSFLEPYFSIDYLDSLSIMENVPNEEYYALWHEKLAAGIDNYSALIGFAFGGVILQQCADKLAPWKKPIILFSAPSFVDAALKEKLEKVIQLCTEEELEDAFTALYQPVFAPNPLPNILPPANKKEGCRRLIFGLQRILNTDSTEILHANKTALVHFIGEQSDLVNAHNVIAPKTGHLFVVPQSSMRVLHDNPGFCHQRVLETLNDENQPAP